MGRRATILTSLAVMAASSCGSPPAATPPSPPAVVVPSPSASAPAAGPQSVDVDVLAEGNGSLLHEAGYQIIQSARQLDSFVKQAGLKDVDTDVDWKTHAVLALYAGDQPGTLDVASLKIRDGILTAKTTFQPGAASATTGSYLLVVIPNAIDDVEVVGLPSGPTAAASPSGAPSPAASPSAVPSSAATPSPAPSAPAGQGVVQILAQGTSSGVHQPVNVIIRTNEEWQAVWGTHAQGAQGQAQPTIDLNQHSVIGIFLGDQPTIGGIALDSIQQTQTGIAVRAHALPAAQGQTASTPFLLISVPKLPAIPVDIQVQGGPQAPTLGNPQQQGQAQPASQPATPGYGTPGGSMARPGFGQPVAGGPQPGFGQPVGGSQLGGMPGGPSYGGANAAPPFPARGSLLTGTGTGGLLGPGGYNPPQ